MEFKNEALKDVYNIAKEGGLKCYTSQDPNKEAISYFHITNGTDIVYCQAHYSGVSFSSEHKVKNGSGLGSGFGLTDNAPVGVNSLEDITHYFTYRPNWTRRYLVNNWKNWEEFAKNQIVLKSKEI